MTRQEREERKKEDVEKAKLILRGADESLDQMRELAKDLKNDTSFG